MARWGGGATIAAAVLGLTVWAAPGIATFSSGNYSGTTSQTGKRVGLKVNAAKTKVSVVYFEFDAPPCGGEGGLQYAGLTAKVHDNGKFKALSPADGYYGFVKGRFHGQMADGTALYHFDANGCNSGQVFWEAHKGH